MKVLLVCICLALVLQSCKKEIPEADVIKMQIYTTRIKYTNYNEPNTLNWYVRAANKGGYFYINSTKNITNFTDYKFQYALNLPKDINQRPVEKEILVEIKQLSGDIYFDITGKEKQN